jgi:hypothetical protein
MLGSFDVISKLTLGEPIGFLEHGNDFNGMIKSQNAVFRYIGVVNNMPVLDALLEWNPFLKLIKTEPSLFFTFARRIVQERLARARGGDSGAGSKSSTAHLDLLGSSVAAQKPYLEIVTDLRITPLRNNQHRRRRQQRGVVHGPHHPFPC